MAWTPNEAKLLQRFVVAGTKTWGSQGDEDFKYSIRQEAEYVGVRPSPGRRYGFVIEVAFDSKFRGNKHPGPDVDNIPKLVVDAFTGWLYPDDNMDHVGAIHVSGEWADGDPPSTTVAIYEL